MNIKLFLALLLAFPLNCSKNSVPLSVESGGGVDFNKVQRVAAARTDLYLDSLRGGQVALVVNATSRIGDTHLVDSLQALGVSIKHIFAPEHGFRGTADAGEQIVDGTDVSSGLPIVSLYGNKKKPTAQQLAGLDWVVFDIQDVGARFYTYISTMHYVMEACAEQGVRFMVLDRPNPNGHYVDGPVLDPAHASFVGMHPVPVVHGMTVGEYARMINGEGWLKNSIQVDLTVIPCTHYDHTQPYDLPVPPSPNLPNMRSIYLYPSLCFFEGTSVSVGRGTQQQFQVYGHPDAMVGDYFFTPYPLPGAKYPKHEGQRCQGYSLVDLPVDSLRRRAQLDLHYLIDFYQAHPEPDAFFLSNNFFDKLAGGTQLRRQILAGVPLAEIRAGWQEELVAFGEVRGRYLLYED